ncbi:hypothetical protein BRARA_C01743 [Brassica rapa]|uniref:Uncharacterized protein n=1 Tax=Brassica campestris TaxID=3711 RepID=A0A397ZVS5_BRACM|nr:hypothetical protein BRARA_C01743 [Brassica rapa]
MYRRGSKCRINTHMRASSSSVIVIHHSLTILYLLVVEIWLYERSSPIKRYRRFTMIYLEIFR